MRVIGLAKPTGGMKVKGAGDGGDAWASPGVGASHLPPGPRADPGHPGLAPDYSAGVRRRAAG